MKKLLDTPRDERALPAYIDGRKAHYHTSVQDRVDDSWHASSHELAFPVLPEKLSHERPGATRQLGRGIPCTVTYVGHPQLTLNVFLNSSRYDSGLVVTHASGNETYQHKGAEPHIIAGTAAVYFSPHNDRDISRRSVHVPENLLRDTRYVSATYHDGNVAVQLDRATRPHRQPRMILIDGGVNIEKHEKNFAELVQEKGNRSIVIHDGYDSYTITPLAPQKYAPRLPEKSVAWNAAAYVPCEGIGITSLSSSLFSMPIDMWLRKDRNDHLILDGSRSHDVEGRETIWQLMKKVDSIVFAEPLFLAKADPEKNVMIHYPEEGLRYLYSSKVYFKRGPNERPHESERNAGYLFPEGTILKKIEADPEKPVSFEKLVAENPDSVVLFDKRSQLGFAIKIPMDRGPVVIPSTDF